MAMDATARRRWFGVCFLLAALAMLIAGQLGFGSRFSPPALLLYWLICFCFTALAILVAIRDARALRQRTRDEERLLLEATLKDLEIKAKPGTRTPSADRPATSPTRD